MCELQRLRPALTLVWGHPRGQLEAASFDRATVSLPQFSRRPGQLHTPVEPGFHHRLPMRSF